MQKLASVILVAIALHSGAALADAKRTFTLSSEEVKHLEQLKQIGEKSRAEVQKAWKKQSRALRGKRRPRGKIRGHLHH